MTPTLSQGQAEPTDARRTLFELARICFDAGIRHGHGAKNDWSSDGKALQIIDRLAASSAAPTADLRAAILNLPSFSGSLGKEFTAGYHEGHRDARHAAAQLAAVAAPEARISLTDEQILACLNSLSPPSGRWKGPREHNIAFARAIEAALRHPAAPGSSTPSAAPLSEPCALDQGARPVRLSNAQVRTLMQIAHKWAGPDENDSRSDDLEMALRAARLSVLPLPAVVQAALGDVHSAAPQTNVPTAAPFSEPRALGQGELPVRLMEVLTFLHGAGPLEGVWFGEDHPTETGRFWWRSRLRAAMSAPGGGGRA